MRTWIRLALPLLATALIAGHAAAHEKTNPASTSTKGPVEVGEKITLKKPVKLAELARDTESYVGKPVRIEGRVKDVCQERGCWVEIEDGKGASFMARSLDHTVLLPKDCVGRKIVVQGVVTKQAAKGHDHEAQEAAEEHEHDGHAHDGHAHEAHGADTKEPRAKTLEAGGHVCPAPNFLVATQGIRLK